MRDLPNFQSYGNYSSANYGVNALVFSMGDVDVYFSYKTPVAFRHPTTGLVVRMNEWGPTTGKHLNAIDGGNGAKAKRINGAEFEARLRRLMEGCQL